MIRPALSPFSALSPRFALALFGTFTLALTLTAQQPVREYSLTDATSEVLPKFKVAADAKN